MEGYAGGFNNSGAETSSPWATPYSDKRGPRVRWVNMFPLTPARKAIALCNKSGPDLAVEVLAWINRAALYHLTPLAYSDLS